MKKLKKRKELGAVIVIIILTVLTMIASLVLSKIGFDGGKTVITNGNFQTNLITVKNIFSVEGIRFLIGNFASNIKIFEPLALLITTLIGASIIESSGILKNLAKSITQVKGFYVTLVVTFVSIISVFFGEYSFLILLPLVSILYKEMGRNPILGVLTVFLGLTIGYGSGIFVNYSDYVLGGITEISAKLNVDSDYTFNADSYAYIKIASTVLIGFFLTYMIENRLVKKLPKLKSAEIEEEPEYNVKKGLLLSGLVILVFMFATILLITPSSFGAKYMLDLEQTNYTAMLFSDASPFREGIFLIVLLAVSLASYVYGTVTKKFKNTQDFSSGFSTYFDGLGLIFVMMFFISQLIAIINWTNIGHVISVNVIEMMSMVKFSGVPLIMTLFATTIVVGLFITSTIQKWEIMAPLAVPLFMRANMTPEYAQFIFKAADGVSKSLTPIFPYYIVLLGFVRKYNNERPISLFGAMRLMLPIILISIGIWLLIIISFYIIGMPIGVSGLSTL